MKYTTLSCITLILATILESTAALKILMAGDQDKDRRAFFYSIAEALTSNPNTNHQVFFLTTEYMGVQKEKINNRLVKYGVGQSIAFEYDRSQTEEENYRRLDLAHLRAYFSE